MDPGAGAGNASGVVCTVDTAEILHKGGIAAVSSWYRVRIDSVTDIVEPTSAHASSPGIMTELAAPHTQATRLAG